MSPLGVSETKGPTHSLPVRECLQTQPQVFRFQQGTFFLLTILPPSPQHKRGRERGLGYAGPKKQGSTENLRG